MPTFEDDLSRFNQIAGGTSSILREEVQIFKGPEGKRRVGFRPLDDDAEAEAEARAYRWCAEHGIDSPGQDHPLFARALYAETIFLGLVNADSPDEAPTPYFTSSVAFLRKSMPTETLAFLYEKWRLWNDRCDPRPLQISAEEYTAKIMEAAGLRDPKVLVEYFLSLRLATRVGLVHSLASLCIASLQDSSPSTQGSASSASSSSPSGVNRAGRRAVGSNKGKKSRNR